MKKQIALLFLLISTFSFAQEMQKEAAFNLIKNNAAELNVLIGNTDKPIVTNAYIDANRGLGFVYFQQQYKGIKVKNQIQSAIFRDNVLLYHSGSFINNIGRIAPSSTPQITAITAIQNAANHLSLASITELNEVDNQFTQDKKIVYSKANISKDNIVAQLVWINDDLTKTINLAWVVSISPVNTSDIWDVKVDALTGTILGKDNNTIYEHFPSSINNNDNHLIENNKKENNKLHTFSAPPPTPITANYMVVPYPYDNPFLTNGLQLETNPWLKAGASNNAITNGWHYDGTTDYNITRGNNVYAYDDSANINGPGRFATSTTASPNLNFNFNFNQEQVPSNESNRNAAITNLFYWNNIVHDITYQYGFDEVGGNFQKDNLSRGGLGNDFVHAQAQDGGGTDNANFATPQDGSSPRMQMYLWTASENAQILSPSTIAGKLYAREGTISANNLLANVPAVTANVILFNDDVAGTTHNACTTPKNVLTGKIALIVYTTTTGCSYAQRVKRCQTAGAVGVIIVYTTNKPILMGGTADNTITIPAVMIGLDEGNKIITQLTASNTVTAKLSKGAMYDGDLDNGIVVHEYGHGVSTRLTGGPANSGCLSNAEEGGEGWSDYMALMLTTNWQTATVNDGPIPRKMGLYAYTQALAGPGIRTYPYSTSITVNPLKYTNMAANGEVHFIGEIWCATLWDMTWNIIQQENAITGNLYDANGTGGNVMAMNLVMMGMKLQPCSPGFLDARDAILAADDILYAGKHKCTIWNAFARRGMGYSAKQGSSASTSDQTVAFDVPKTVTLAKLKDYKVLQSTQTTSFNLKATCQCKIPTNNYKIKAIIPTGFAYSSSVGGVSNADSVVFSGLNYNKYFQTDSVSLTIKATGVGCALDSVVNDNRDANTKGGFAHVQISGSNAWVTDNALSYSPVNSWWAQDLETSDELALKSTAFTVTNTLTLLSFWHNYLTEGSYDGGLVEVSTNGGSTWQALDNNFIKNGYSATMSTGTPLAGSKAFSGVSNGFINSVADLTSFAGTNTMLRFRFGTDVQNGGMGIIDGWRVDDIAVVNGCGKYIKFYMYDSANKLIDSSSMPIFIVPKVLPVKMVSFTAKKVATTTQLQWLVAEEINVKKYAIEKSNDGNNWKEIGYVNASIDKHLQYGFTDKNPFIGVNYYRIKAIDLDGSTTYSTIQKINFNKAEGNSIIIVPNPAIASAKLYIPQSFNATQLQVFDAVGKTIYNKSIGNTTTEFIEINTSNFKQGTYIINVVNSAGEMLMEKLVVTK